MGIEPTYSAWEADVLPLNYTRIYLAGSAHIRAMGSTKFVSAHACSIPIAEGLHICDSYDAQNSTEFSAGTCVYNPCVFIILCFCSVELNHVRSAMRGV